MEVPDAEAEWLDLLGNCPQEISKFPSTFVNSACIICPLPPAQVPDQSSSGGSSSSIYRIKLIRISVVSFPLNTSLMKCASTCICTISSAPLSTPQKMLEYQSSSCARPSSGSSTKSARGFSSKTSENCLLSLVQFVMVGVMLRKILKPT